MSQYFTKFINIFRYLISTVCVALVTAGKRDGVSSGVLLVRLDAIGDYILFQNFIKLCKDSARFSEKKFTLMGNVLWKDIATMIHANEGVHFIWVDRRRFNNSIFYKYRVLKEVYQDNYEYCIDTTFTREVLFGDMITKACRAIYSIGSSGSTDRHVTWKRNIFSRNIFTETITASGDVKFEFFRNKEFFSLLTSDHFTISCPEIPRILLPAPPLTIKNYIVIFPGAKDTFRRWSPNKYAELITRMVGMYNPIFIIAGGSADIRPAEEIISRAKDAHIISLAGATTLPQLASLLANSQILISNDTVAIHLAAAVRTPFVCISNGNHYGRFNPYPTGTFPDCSFVYPFGISRGEVVKEFEEKYYFSSALDINCVSVDAVLGEIRWFDACI